MSAPHPSSAHGNSSWPKTIAYSTATWGSGMSVAPQLIEGGRAQSLNRSIYSYPRWTSVCASSGYAWERTSENAVKTKFTPARSEESWQAVATCYRLSQEYRDPFVLPSNSGRASGRGYRPPARRCRSLDLASKFGWLRFAPLPFSEL